MKHLVYYDRFVENKSNSSEKKSTKKSQLIKIPTNVDAKQLMSDLTKSMSSMGISFDDNNPKEIEKFIATFINKDGNINKITKKDLNEAYLNEIYLTELNEAVSIDVLHSVAVVGEFVGIGAGLGLMMEAIAKMIEKYTGKQVDPNKILVTLKKIFEWIESIASSTNQAYHALFSWLYKKIFKKASSDKTYIAGEIGEGLVIIVFITLGIIFFPAIGHVAAIEAVIMAIFSLASKVTELIKLAVRISKHIRNPETIEADKHEHHQKNPIVKFNKYMDKKNSKFTIGDVSMDHG